MPRQHDWDAHRADGGGQDGDMGQRLRLRDQSGAVRAVLHVHAVRERGRRHKAARRPARHAARRRQAQRLHVLAERQRDRRRGYRGERRRPRRERQPRLAHLARARRGDLHGGSHNPRSRNDGRFHAVHRIRPRRRRLRRDQHRNAHARRAELRHERRGLGERLRIHVRLRQLLALLPIHGVGLLHGGD